MENQHFVPKTYLKHFCKNEELELYATKFIPTAKKWSTPKSRHISSICYEGDYYNLDESIAKYHSVKKNHIERNAFWYEREYFDELVKQVFNGEVESNIIDQIPHFFLNMKARNPVFRNNYSKENIQKAFENTLLGFKEKFSWLDESFLDDIIKKNKEDLLNSDDGRKKLHNASLLKTTLGVNKVFQEILDKVCTYNYVFYKIENENDFFITSDAPGFSVGNNDKVQRIKFNDDMYHFMPLHPKIAVGLMNPIHYNTNERVKVISASKDQINQLNYGTTVTRTEYLFGLDENHLKAHTEEIYPKSI